MILTDICFILRIRAAFLPHLKEGTPAAILLNGAKSADVWRRFGAPTLSPNRLARLRVEVCPSTSPANARWRREDLVRVWRAALLG